jgi:hypothetical protein
MEAAFRAGIITTLFCTSTLAAGVNLPAQRCIIRCGLQRFHIPSRASYLQMIGRAGRAGYCSAGQSFLVCDWEVKPNLIKNGQSVKTCLGVVRAPMPSLKSNLVPPGWAKADEKRMLYARDCPSATSAIIDLHAHENDLHAGCIVGAELDRVMKLWLLPQAVQGFKEPVVSIQVPSVIETKCPASNARLLKD